MRSNEKHQEPDLPANIIAAIEVMMVGRERRRRDTATDMPIWQHRSCHHRVYPTNTTLGQSYGTGNAFPRSLFLPVPPTMGKVVSHPYSSLTYLTHSQQTRTSKNPFVDLEAARDDNEEEQDLTEGGRI